MGREKDRKLRHRRRRRAELQKLKAKLDQANELKKPERLLKENNKSAFTR